MTAVEMRGLLRTNGLLHRCRVVLSWSDDQPGIYRIYVTCAGCDVANRDYTAEWPVPIKVIGFALQGVPYADSNVTAAVPVRSKRMILTRDGTHELTVPVADVLGFSRATGAHRATPLMLGHDLESWHRRILALGPKCPACGQALPSQLGGCDHAYCVRAEIDDDRRIDFPSAD